MLIICSAFIAMMAFLPSSCSGEESSMPNILDQCMRVHEELSQEERKLHNEHQKIMASLSSPRFIQNPADIIATYKKKVTDATKAFKQLLKIFAPLMKRKNRLITIDTEPLREFIETTTKLQQEITSTLEQQSDDVKKIIAPSLQENLSDIKSMNENIVTLKERIDQAE